MFDGVQTRLSPFHAYDTAYKRHTHHTRIYVERRALPTYGATLGKRMMHQSTRLAHHLQPKISTVNHISHSSAIEVL